MESIILRSVIFTGGTQNLEVTPHGWTPGSKHPSFSILLSSDLLPWLPLVETAAVQKARKPIGAIHRGPLPGFKVGTIYKIGAEIKGLMERSNTQAHRELKSHSCAIS